MIVLDSSAMLAYLHGEAGGQMVAQVMSDPAREVPVCAHAVQLCEVFYDFLRTEPMARAEEALFALRADGVKERSDMDAAFWHDMAFIISSQRKGGHRLALGDSFGLALCRREGATFYTADRGEIQAVADAGLCAVTFIR